jgi:CDP-glucose 4,6-dehydratase
MGASVHGYSLNPPTQPSFFEICKLHNVLAGHQVGDLRDLEKLRAALRLVKPDLVFHLAAQPLVRHSYREPIETYATNVMGTLHLLEAARSVSSVRSVVCVTTDKCYENREWLWPYRESDALGGHDPYSSSKACAELLCTSFRRSYLMDDGFALATARAGNVIGGGDWAPDRLLPDLIRASDEGETVEIRSPDATRPWQHVLEPLAGYLLLAQALSHGGNTFAEAWNFGPATDDVWPVSRVVDYFVERIGGKAPIHRRDQQLHEAGALLVDSAKASSRLRWRPRWDIQTALDRTVDWYHEWRQGGEMSRYSLEQISAYGDCT